MTASNPCENYIIHYQSKLGKINLFKIENDLTIQSSMLIKYGLIIVIGLFFAFDFFTDMSRASDQLTTYIEGLAFLLVVLLLIWQLRENMYMNQQLNVIRDENNKLSEDLNNQIETEFCDWKLTPSEKEIAWLIIKGFLIKEIAYSRSVSEKTIHAQLTSIYRKSGVKNRSEFVTLFLQRMFDDNTANDKH